MPKSTRTRVFMSGRSQHVTIPVEFRFSGNEVFIRRDEQTGNLILSQAAETWQEIFAALAADPFPDDFLADRGQGRLSEREIL